MQKLLFCLIFLPLLSYATGVSVMANTRHTWDVYYTSPSAKRFFIYEDTDHVNAQSISGGELFYKTQEQTVWIIFTCWQEKMESCARFINLKTAQESPIFIKPALAINQNQETMGPLANFKENVVVTFNYPSDWQYTVTPIFKPCKHPFVYPLQHLSDGPDAGSAFLPNGSLHLNMLMNAGPNQSVTIPIDYKKLYADCAS